MFFQVGKKTLKKLNRSWNSSLNIASPAKIYHLAFERYRFNKRMQEAGETCDQYLTAAQRKLTEGCEFHTITPEEILRDRLVFGIRDNKIW
jgi:hypothetical protein